MASSPLRAPVGQPQSRLLDMQKKFQQKHLATVAAVKGSTTTPSNSSTSITSSDPPVPPIRKFGAGASIVPPQPQQRRGTGSAASGDNSVVQVDVKGKVRQLFAERNQQQGPGHQNQRRQRRRSLTGRDRSRPLRPLSGEADDDPLCKTVCFNAPSLASGADIVGMSNAGDVRGELLALFGRLPNLGGQLLSQSFRGDTKMKTAQSAPELKWLMDGGDGSMKNGQGPGPPPAVAPKGAAKGTVPRPGKAAPAKATAETGGGDNHNDNDDDDNDQQQQRPAAVPRINSKTATIVKKPTATVNGNGGMAADRGFKKPNDSSGSMTNTSRLLLPPVVQPTVINALAAGAGAAAAVASVSEAAAAGVQKPLVRAGRMPIATQKPAPPPVRQRTGAVVPSKATPAAKLPVARKPAPASVVRPTSTRKQLSEDRGPPAKGMARCPLCARDFAADRLPKHEEVCRRTRDRDRKRKVFDTSRKRLEGVAADAGVDIASFKKKSQKEDQRAAEKLQKKKDAWRRKHDALVRNVRNARAVQRHLAAGGTVRDLPPELENAGADQDDEIDSDLVKCPHCGRTFNEASAERHIPLCADRQRNANARLQNKKR